MRRTQVALVLFVFLLLLPSISALLSAAGWDSVFGVLGLVLIGVLVASIVIKHHRTERDDDTNEGFWDGIPDWQYEGRFAEAGGLTRSEQSEAVEQIQTNANEIESNRR